MIWAVAFVLLVALLLLSIPVAATMAGLGLILGKVFTPFPLYRSLGEISWEGSTNFTLFAIPLFILLGQFLVHSGIADRTYKAVDTWLCGLPGGLMHANVATCALFAATSGSSVATTFAVGAILGSLAGGRVAARANPRHLTIAFVVMLLVIAALMLGQNVPDLA